MENQPVEATVTVTPEEIAKIPAELNKKEFMQAWNWSIVESEKFLRGLFLSVIAASLTYTTAYLAGLHLGVFAPIVMFFWANFANAIKLYVSGVK